MKRFRKHKKGGALLEFALGSVILITVLIGVLEFGIEIFARNTTERLTNRAAEVYALTRDLEAVDEVLSSRADAITQRCLQPVDIDLFDSVTTSSPFDQAGRTPDGTAADDTAVAFRLTISCDWPRITPLMGNLLGPDGGHAASIVLRFKS